MSPPDWIIPAASIAAAGLVAGGNFIVQRWRYRIDRTGLAIDHLCTEINAAADLATRYWLLDASQHQERQDARNMEPQLIGRQMRIQQLAGALAVQDSRLDLAQIDQLMPDLFDALTGGDFLVDRRSASAERARAVQATAADLNGRLRASLAHRSWRLF